MAAITTGWLPPGEARHHPDPDLATSVAFRQPIQCPSSMPPAPQPTSPSTLAGSSPAISTAGTPRLIPSPPTSPTAKRSPLLHPATVCEEATAILSPESTMTEPLPSPISHSSDEPLHRTDPPSPSSPASLDDHPNYRRSSSPPILVSRICEISIPMISIAPISTIVDVSFNSGEPVAR